MENETGLRAAIKVVGNQATLAEKLGVRQQSVSEWVRRNTVPAERVLDIERLTGVPRHEIRPDLYPAERRA